MNSRERFLRTMSFEKPDRLPVVEWAPYWDQTLERWYAEGLDPLMTDPSEIAEHLGFERYERIKVPARFKPALHDH